MNILINRNDNLGDIIYTLHLAGLLKKYYPHCHICFLIRDYATGLFAYAPDVDNTLSWESLNTLPVNQRKQTLQQFDIFINAKANKKAAFYAWQAGIKTRIGNSKRWYHFLFCNKYVFIKRKNSTKHEVELNAKLLSPLIPKLSFNCKELFNFIRLDKNLANQPNFDLPNKKLVICHPASNGNGREWPVENYIKLIQSADLNKYHFILTGSKNEKLITEQIEKACPTVTNLAGTLSLFDFISLITKVDVLIASGTGPLHIAAAIGTKTLGLFPPIHALDSKRWGPIFSTAQNLELKKNCQVKCNNFSCLCMKKLMPETLLELMA